MQTQKCVNYGYDYAVLWPECGNDAPLQVLPLVKPRSKDKAAKKIQTQTSETVRPTESISIATVFGFVAVAVIAVMILFGYAKLNTINAETVALQNELDTLQEEGERLETQYEEIFDPNTLQEVIENADVDLIEPSSEQKVYVDLSDPDNAVVYEGNSG